MEGLLIENLLIAGSLVALGFLACALLVFCFTRTIAQKNMLIQNWRNLAQIELQTPRALTRMRRRAPLLYRQSAEAAVQLLRGGHGILLNYCGEVILLTTAHCLRRNGVNRDDFGKLSNYYREASSSPDIEWGELAHYAGYGFLECAPCSFAIKAEAIKVDIARDLACVRGLFSDSKLLAGRRLLKLSDTNPDIHEPLLVLHGQPQEWRLWNSLGKISAFRGALLVPNLGFGLGQGAEPSALNSMFWAAYAGDSGLPFVNEKGELAGLIRGAIIDKTKEILTETISPLSIREFLEWVWAQDATAEVKVENSSP